MAGLSPQRARQLYGIPEDFEPVAAMAIGYPGNPNDLPDELRELELRERSRRPQAEFVFSGLWGKAWRDGP